jgi:hypothetical protein
MTQGFDPSSAGREAAARAAREAQFQAQLSQDASLRLSELSRRGRSGSKMGRRRRNGFVRLIGFLLKLVVFVVFAGAIIGAALYVLH